MSDAVTKSLDQGSLFLSNTFEILEGFYYCTDFIQTWMSFAPSGNFSVLFSK